MGMQWFGEASPEFIQHRILDIGQVFLWTFSPPRVFSFIFFGHFVAACWSISTGRLLAALAYVNLNLKLIGLPGRWPLVVALFFFEFFFCL